MLSTYYFQHALNCGINMTGKMAIAVEDSAGCMLMSTVIDPVSLQVRIPTGIIMDTQLMDVVHTLGIDYVIVLDPNHPILKKA